MIDDALLKFHESQAFLQSSRDFADTFIFIGARIRSGKICRGGGHELSNRCGIMGARSRRSKTFAIG